ncbi:hypothetical protein RRG08_038188 [Elysia crispata]|uniref:Uncharacterized protein n=1 Tax=Elysia crispata TaxID=231223 RepID=A0AAE1E1C3_9GAST|nr:hypothetical protein RRG08_038188 [Elysia crispata]
MSLYRHHYTETIRLPLGLTTALVRAIQLAGAHVPGRLGARPFTERQTPCQVREGGGGWGLSNLVNTVSQRQEGSTPLCELGEAGSNSEWWVDTLPISGPASHYVLDETLPGYNEETRVHFIKFCHAWQSVRLTDTEDIVIFSPLFFTAVAGPRSDHGPSPYQTVQSVWGGRESKASSHEI